MHLGNLKRLPKSPKVPKVTSEKLLAREFMQIRLACEFDSGSAAQGPVGYPYYIETADGRVHSGVLDANGELPRVHTGDGSGDYTVYWGDEAIAKKHTGVSHA